jgi:hypothetical protein
MTMFELFVKKETGLTIVTEFKFCETRKFKSDYFIPELMLLIESEGGIFTKQAHGSIKGILRDIEKYNLATILGYRILRYQPKDLISYKTIEDINKIKGLCTFYNQHEDLKERK